MDTCMAGILRHSPETVTTLLVGYTSQYKIKTKKKMSAFKESVFSFCSINALASPFQLPLALQIL